MTNDEIKILQRKILLKEQLVEITENEIEILRRELAQLLNKKLEEENDLSQDMRHLWS